MPDPGLTLASRPIVQGSWLASVPRPAPICDSLWEHEGAVVRDDTGFGVGLPEFEERRHRNGHRNCGV